ncbi:PAS domain S-box protein [Halorientalis halophila]|uniref:PAS domain S-box protein n=1 Tax=Halorientalis halophila TaxID=3108499 RepID=UPI0030083469
MSRAARHSGEWWVDPEKREQWPEPDHASKAILDTLTDSLYVLDRSGLLVDWNARFGEIVGKSDEELAEMDPLTLIPEYDRERAATALGRVACGEEVSLVLDVETAEDGPVPHEVTAAPLYEDGEVWGLVGTARDVSERKARERDLERYKSLLETVGDGVYVLDEDLRLAKVNDAMATLTGYDREELLGMHYAEFLDAETAERGRELAESLLETDRTVETIECELVRKDGTRLPVEGRFSVTTDEEYATIGLVRDISDRRERERDLERYKSLLETLGDGVYLVDDDRYVRKVNDAMTSMVGADRDELLGRHVSEFVDPETAERGRQLSTALKETGETVTTMECDLLRADGSRLPIEGRFSTVSDDEYATIGLVRDVSERRERAELLERLHRGTRDLMAAETRREVAEAAAAVSQRHFEFSSTGVRLETEDGRLEPVAVDTDEERFDQSLPTYEVGEGFVGRTYERGEPVVIDDFHDLETAFDYDPMRSALLLPVEGYGIIGIGSTETDAFDDTDRELGRLFAADVESAFRRAEREEKLRERTEELRRYETLVETMSDGVYMTDADNRLRMVNDAAEEKFGYDPEEFYGTNVGSLGDGTLVDEDFLREAQRERAALLDGERSVGTVEGRFRTAAGDEIAIENRFSLLPPEDGEFAGTVGVVRDVTDRKEHERQLRTQRDELETLNRINELVQETIRALASAATAEEIEETVCERLGGSSLYRFAFTGVERPGEAVVEPKAWAGDGAGYLDAVDIPVEMDHERAGPAAKTFETGEVTVTHDVTSDPLSEPFREQAMEYDFRSIATIPFNHRGVTHGLLIVYADRRGAFSDREITAFELLGEMVGFAISATQNRKLIESDERLAVTFELDRPDTFFSTVSAELDCTCRLLGSAAAADDERLTYAAISGASPEAVRDIAAAEHVPTPDHLRLVTETDEHAVFEARVGSSLTAFLYSVGVEPVDVESRAGLTTVDASAPSGFDLRGLTERLDDRFGGVTLAAKRESTSPPDPAETTCEDLADDLTDRQQAALSAAYFGGYFDWPRDSTAEEVADSLGITSPTLHQHLRHAERKLLAAFFDDGPP